MSILGVIVRARPDDLAGLKPRLAALAGVELAEVDAGARPAPEDGRLVLVIEDAADRAAAATLGEIALWPEVLNTSLVYEYSGPDSPAPEAAVADYRAWRGSLKDLGQPAAGTPRAADWPAGSTPDAT
jgi:nitrate reductase NapAB chaperone NapD